MCGGHPKEALKVPALLLTGGYKPEEVENVSFVLCHHEANPTLMSLCDDATLCPA